MLGASTGVDSTTVGSLLGAVVMPDGGILALERGTLAWYRFDAGGTLVGKRVAKGGGPGEFWEPHGLAIGRGDTLVVADAPTRRVTLFATRGERFPRYIRSFPLNAVPTDLCLTRDRIVVATSEPDHLLVMYSWSGDEEAKIGPRFGDSLDTEMMRDSKSMAVIACAEDGEAVFASSIMSPEVVKIAIPSGEVEWSTVLAEAPGIRWTSDAPGRLTLRSPPGGYDRRLGLLLWASDTLLVTMARVTWDSVLRVQDFAPHVRVLDAATGRELGRLLEGPPLRIRDRSRSLAYSIEELPEPAIGRFAVRSAH
jgi:hypothetical protein